MSFSILLSLIACVQTSLLPQKTSGGVRARGGDLMPETSPNVRLLIVRSDPGVGTFDFDRQKPVINSEAVAKSVPRGFLKVTVLEN